MFPQIYHSYNPFLSVQCCQQNISLCNLKDYRRTALCSAVATLVHASGSNNFLKNMSSFRTKSPVLGSKYIWQGTLR